MKFIITLDTESPEIVIEKPTITRDSYTFAASEPLKFLTHVRDDLGVSYIRTDNQPVYGLLSWYSPYYNFKVQWSKIRNPMIVIAGS